MELTENGKVLRELFDLEYPHIYLDDSHNHIVNEHAERMEKENYSTERALDYLQDHIMSQGLADYQE
jgi:hypothetical protein